MNYDRDTGNVPIRAFFTNDNDGITINAIGDYSSANANWALQPPPGETWFIDSLGILLDGGQRIEVENYGPATAHLTNGYRIYLINQDTTVAEIQGPGPIKNTLDLLMFTQTQANILDFVGSPVDNFVFQFKRPLVIGNGLYLSIPFSDDFSSLGLNLNIFHVVGHKLEAYL